jgi:hypothetical protein
MKLNGITQLLFPLENNQIIMATTNTTNKIPTQTPALKIPPIAAQLLINKTIETNKE